MGGNVGIAGAAEDAERGQFGGLAGQKSVGNAGDSGMVHAIADEHSGFERVPPEVLIEPGVPEHGLNHGV